MKKLTKFFNGVLVVALLATPFVLTAKHDCSSSNHEHHHHHQPDKKIRFKDVIGIYQISGFSNNLGTAGTLEQPQSQGLIGQIELSRGGVARIIFLEQSLIVNNQLVSLRSENVPVTYSLGPINGFAQAVISNFPTPGTDLTFAISFKMHEGKVVGFSQLLTSSTTPFSRWTLIQGERFN